MATEDQEDDVLSPAFSVPETPLPEENLAEFLQKPPISGEEYLRQVRAQARLVCPGVVVAECVDKSVRERDVRNSTAYLLHHSAPPCPTAPQELMPALKWQREFLFEFAKFRQHIQWLRSLRKEHQPDQIRVPFLNDKSGWFSFCFGSQNNPEGHLPTPSLITQLDFVTVKKLLDYHITWFIEKTYPPPRNHLVWMYVLLASVDKPLDSNSSGSIRSLLRFLSLARSKMNVSSEFLPVTNILITVASQYFGQGEEEP